MNLVAPRARPARRASEVAIAEFPFTDPVAVFAALRGRGAAALLDSAAPGPDTGRYTIIGVDPAATVRGGWRNGFDRLGELLAPYADYSEGRGGEAADERTVEEVEEILGTVALPPSDRLRAKAEVVEFLEGRLEPSLFIDRCVDRQYAREGPRHAESQSRRQEMRLSTHES